MTKLEESRAVIDTVDKELVKLFEQRFQAVKGVMEYKLENGLPVLDSSREQQIIAKHTNELSDPSLAPYFKAWYQNMLAVSRQYQTDLMEEKKNG